MIIVIAFIVYLVLLVGLVRFFQTIHESDEQIRHMVERKR
jgi:hypothetical protein